MSKVKETSVRVDDSDEEEVAVQGIWNNIKFKKQTVLATVLDFVKVLDINYKKVSMNQLLDLVFTRPEDEEDALKYNQKVLKRHRKRQAHTNEDKFIAKDLHKPPPSSYTYFMSEQKKEALKTGKKKSLDELQTEWHALSSKARKKLDDKLVKEKETYEKEFQRLKQEAIDRGEIAKPKPKRPVPPHIRVRTILMSEYSKKYNLSEEDKELPDKERREKHNELTKQREEIIKKKTEEFDSKELAKFKKEYEKENAKFKMKMEEWKKEEAERQAKLASKAKGEKDNENPADDNADSSDDDNSTEAPTKELKRNKHRVKRQKSPIKNTNNKGEDKAEVNKDKKDNKNSKSEKDKKGMNKPKREPTPDPPADYDSSSSSDSENENENLDLNSDNEQQEKPEVQVAYDSGSDSSSSDSE